MNVICAELGLYILSNRCGTQQRNACPVCFVLYKVQSTNFSIIIETFECFSAQYIYGCCNFTVTKETELFLFHKCHDYFTFKIISSCPGKSFFLLTHILCILSQAAMRKTFFFTGYGMRVTTLDFVGDLETSLWT